MKSSLSPRAMRQMNEIYAYLQERNPSAAAAVMRKIQSTISYLEFYPYFGRATDKANVRVLPVVNFPYLIFYRVYPTRDEVRVLNVRHGARRHPGFQEETAKFVI